MVKAIFFDIDGTLVSFKTHTVPDETVQALHALREKGILLFISTGRHVVMLKRILSLFDFDGYITLNGQYCFCGDEVLRQTALTGEETKQLVTLAREQDLACIFLEKNSIYINKENQDTRLFSENVDLDPPVVRPLETALDGEIYQVIVFLEEKDDKMLKKRVAGMELMRWHPTFVDAIAGGGGKDKGMDVIAERFGFSMEECLAFGDGENDISMLRHAGIGVAMGNGSDVVKSAADYVTADVDDGGIVKALRHFGVL